jgi:hypothetical protein
VFEGSAADFMSSVELHQVKTLGVARDPDTGTKLFLNTLQSLIPKHMTFLIVSFTLIHYFNGQFHQADLTPSLVVKRISLGCMLATGNSLNDRIS